MSSNENKRHSTILQHLSKFVSNGIDLIRNRNNSHSMQNVFDDVFGSSDVPAMVMPHLFVSSQTPAMNKDRLKKLNITHIINLASCFKNAFPDEFCYLQISIADSPTENLLAIIPQTNKFIDDALRQSAHNNVLVHCNAGVSRSVSVVIAYLLYKQQRLSLSEALDIVRNVRPCAYPNDGFMKQLKFYESSRLIQ